MTMKVALRITAALIAAAALSVVMWPLALRAQIVNGAGGGGGSGGGSPATTPNYVAVGGTTTAGTSSADGRTWTARTLPSPSGATWRGLAWGGGIFVAVSDATVGAYSSDGSSWTSSTIANNTWSSVAYGGGTFCAITNNTSQPAINSTNGGQTWTSQSSLSAIGGPALKVTYGGTSNLFITASQGTLTGTSSDCVTWTSRSGIPGAAFQTIAASPTNVCMIGNSGRTLTSPDGVSWTDHVGAFAGGTFLPNSATYSARLGLFVLVDSISANSWTSSNCVSWTQGTLPSSAAWSAVTESGTQLVAVATTASNKAAYSPDGLIWTAATLSASQTWLGVVSGNPLTASSGSIALTGPISTLDVVTAAGFQTGGKTTTSTLAVGTVNAVTSLSEHDFGSGRATFATPATGSFAQALVTNASTVTAGSYIMPNVVGVGAGNLVVKLCSDGATCAGGNVYLTCTQSCTASVGTAAACTVTKSAVTAATTMTFSVGTACATTDPGFTVNAHYTTP